MIFFAVTAMLATTGSFCPDVALITAMHDLRPTLVVTELLPVRAETITSVENVLAASHWPPKYARPPNN